MSHCFALLSELPRLTPAQRTAATHIICDDGEWSEDRIATYIDQWMATACETPDDDWTRP